MKATTMFHGKKSRTLPAMLVLLLILASPALGAGDGRTPEWEFKTKEGYRLLEAGEYEAALRFFDEALHLNPQAALPKTGKGMVLARQGNLQEAERYFREALALNPDPCRTHYELGLIYQRQGLYSQAAAEFKLGIDKCRNRTAGR